MPVVLLASVPETFWMMPPELGVPVPTTVNEPPGESSRRPGPSGTVVDPFGKGPGRAAASAASRWSSRGRP